MSETIKLLQDFLKKSNWDAFLVPHADEHLSEYLSSHAERLKWVSNFSGSAGIAVIMQNKAAIFTDGRYTNQVLQEVDTRYFRILHLKEFDTWIVSNLSNNSTLTIDSRLFSKNSIDVIKKNLNGKNIKLNFIDKNPIDFLWKNQPNRPCSDVFIYDVKYAGKSMQDKISEIQEALRKTHCNYFIFCALDTIAWILNIRGSDIDYTPVNIANLIIPEQGKPTLYINLKKISKRIIDEMSYAVNFSDYDQINDDLDNIPKTSIVGFDENRTPYWFFYKLNKNNINTKVLEDYGYLEKSKKNPTELNGAKKANIRDGISVTRFIYWLKNEANIELMNEIIAAEKLHEFRKKNKLYHSQSFETISAFGKNAALPHYRVTNKTNSNFAYNQIYLFDSGAQYFDGTTDITRTVVIGRPTDEQKDRFTRVLKGHIGIACLKFKKNTRGSEIDYIARKSLLDINCDYDHGTGHGIGCFSGVHEGPQRIFKSDKKNDAFLISGMIISNEPGFYKVGEYGIRIENLLIVKEIGGDTLGFETISWAPIDRGLILQNLLNNSEMRWINNYHQKVFDNLSHGLRNHELIWLNEVTKPL